MDQTISNIFQVLGYVVAPILLAIALYYGTQRNWGRKDTAAREVQEKGTQRLYAQDEEELKRKAEAAKNSSNPIDVIERKTDTTG
jgi:hypothetical protein